MEKHGEESWQFGPFQLLSATQELICSGVVVPVEPQSFRVLEYLIRHRDRVVSRDELIEHIWQRAAVTDWAVSGAIKSVRTALNDIGRPKQYLRTVHGRGYRFVADVQIASTQEPMAKTLTENSSVRCILVREFASHMDGQDETYLADGMTEDLITDLARLTSHRVLSRNASRMLSDQADSVGSQITDLIDGSLRRIGQTIRVNISLSQAGQNFPTWTERFDFAPSSLIAAQDQISLRLAGVLDPDGAERQPGRVRATSAAAYDHYLRGRFAYYRYDPKSFAEALGHFEAATESDPTFADAFAHQAYCRTALYVFQWPGAGDNLDRAEELARMAIALDDRSALTFARLGWVLGYRHQPEATIEAFDRALMLGHGNAEAMFAYGETMNRLAQPDRALELLEQAFAKDSFHPPSWEFAKGHARVLLGEFDAAIAHFTAVLSRVARFIPARVQLARALQEHGQHSAAQDMVRLLKSYAPKYSLAAAERMFPYPDAQQKSRLIKALSEAGLE